MQPASLSLVTITATAPKHHYITGNKTTRDPFQFFFYVGTVAHTQRPSPLGALAPGAHGGDGQGVVLPLHVHQVVDGLLAGQHVLLAQRLLHDQVGQGNHLGERHGEETEKE